MVLGLESVLGYRLVWPLALASELELASAYQSVSELVYQSVLESLLVLELELASVLGLGLGLAQL
jgi:hypothetical protein